MTEASRKTIATADWLARQTIEPAHTLRRAAVAALRDSAPPAPLTAARALLTERFSAEFGRPERQGEFADAFAQLVVFSLFVAHADVGGGGSDSAGRWDELPIWAASPSLERMVTALVRGARSLPGGDEALARLHDLLTTAALPTVLDSVRRRTGDCDPLPHFYETFLAWYDSPARRQRGVYYTPAPVVSYLVRSVDHILRTQFGLPDGLAARQSTRELRIVDPACGVGVFLSGVVEHLRRSCADRCSGKMWRGYVQQRLLRRLVGLEVLPGSCAAAHFLLHRQLAIGDRTGDGQRPNNACFLAEDDRFAVHLANPLVEDVRRQAGWLAAENGRPILAILGNPPYANFGRRNRGDWIRQLLADYKRGLGEKKLNLDDDFIKFIRWAQFWIDWAGGGVLAFITSNTYLTGLTHRQMRRSLCDSFDDIYLLDLHGGGARTESPPPGVRDENLFDIQTGVAIGVFVRRPVKGAAAQVCHADLWGSRAQKHEVLAAADISTTRWTRVSQHAGPYFFAPRAADGAKELRQFPRIDQLFDQYISGVQTKRDSLFVAFTREEAARRMRAFFDQGRRGDRRLAAGPEAGGQWLEHKAAGLTYSDRHLQPYVVAPFDERWVYYDPLLLGRARYSVMRHVLAGSPALAFMRQSTNRGQYDHFLAVNSLASDRVFYSVHGAPFLAPIYLRHGQQRVPNLNPAAVREFTERLGLRFHPEERRDPDTAFHAEDLFHYLYALFHSPTYRSRYQETLQIDFPRIPITSDRSLFRRLCRWGGRLVSLHAFDAEPRAGEAPTFPVSGDNVVAPGRPKWTAAAGASRSGPRQEGDNLPGGRILINSTQYFEGVSQPVWEFRIGGHQVLSRWLKQRRSRRLEREDIDHVTRMIAAVRETARLMRQIDAAIPRWPIR